MFKLRYGLMIGAGLAALIGVAHSQNGSLGFWSNWPILGNPGFCSSFVNSNCVQTVPAGTPAITGNELIPLDTQLPGGQFPQSERVSIGMVSQHGQGSNRNALIGGDFDLNLWQRGTTPQSAATPSTSALSADRWAVYSSGNTVTITKDTTAGDISPATGINAAMKITRPSSTNTTAICVGQILPQADSVRFLAASNGATGAQAILSFYANPLSGFLSTNDDIIATIAVYTDTDSATPGTNTDKFMKGTIGGYTVINPTSATVTTAPVIPLQTGWNRYSVTGVVPATVSTNAVTGIGITICTPVYPASTGTATDGFLLANVQLETGVAANATTGALAQTTPGGFARRLPADEANAQLSYSYVLTDGAATITYASGYAISSAVAHFFFQFPVQMRETPTLTVGTTISFGVAEANGTATTCGTSIAAAASSTTARGTRLVCTTGGTALTAAQGTVMLGAATGANLTWSAEP